MIAAVVNLAALRVVNIILADAGVDLAPDGCELVDITNGPSCNIGWLYVPSLAAFFNPVTPLFGTLAATSSGRAVLTEGA